MNNKKNLASAIILQMVTMASGLILPRLLISTFGSEVNGLVSSITQFLSFISLLEGGLGAIVLSELYKPIKENDNEKIVDILNECQNFFCKLSIAFIIYSLFLSIVYPLLCNVDFSFIYVSSLVVILSISTLIRYLFAISNRLFLQADQRLYIVNNVSSVVTVLNLVLVIVIIRVFPEIHLIKILADVLFCLQPIVFRCYVDRKYRTRLRITKANQDVLKNRWSGFGQNLAYFINMNTDIAVITIFMGVREVSVYTVYMLAVNALRQLLSSISNSYQSALGKYYVDDNRKVLREKFSSLEEKNWVLSLAMYGTCLLLINPFVSLYTSGINDANYYQPIFAMFIVLANMIFSIREPHKFLILAVGKFKETNVSAIVEAILNIGISLVLVYFYGLIGVAIGTLIAILYRFVFFVIYLKDNIIKVSLRRYVPMLVASFIVVTINISVYFKVRINVNSIICFAFYGMGILVIELVSIIALWKLCNAFRYGDNKKYEKKDN